MGWRRGVVPGGCYEVDAAAVGVFCKIIKKRLRIAFSIAPSRNVQESVFFGVCRKKPREEASHSFPLPSPGPPRRRRLVKQEEEVGWDGREKREAYVAMYVDG